MISKHLKVLDLHHPQRDVHNVPPGRRRGERPRCGLWAGALVQRPWDAGRVTPEDLAHLRRARDLMDREYLRPLDVPAMARVALMSSAHFSRQFRAAYGETPQAPVASSA